MSNIKKRIDLLDYLKAFSIIMVIVTHYDWVDKDGFEFTGVINMAVPIFMIISGYNFAMSYVKKTDGSLRQMYSRKMLLPRLDRFLTPFFFILMLEWFLKFATGKGIDYWHLLTRGGYGPGSYYVPLMIQLLFLFPIIFWLVKKDPVIGVVSVGIVNLLYEIGVAISGIDKSSYRISIGRYLLLIALGAYLYLHPQRKLKDWQLQAMFFVGMFFQIVVLRMDIDMGLFPYWKTTTMLISFYIFPIIVILFRTFYHSHINGVVGDLLVLMGKASYHIFLVQMVYYHFELGGTIMNTAWYLAIPYNLLITIAAGIGFYNLENWIRGLANGGKRIDNRNTSARRRWQNNPFRGNAI